MILKCLQCDHEFEGTISRDDLGWHSCCPFCGGSFDVDVPHGKIIIAFTNPEYDKDDPYENFVQRMPERNICSYYAFASRREFLEKWEKLAEDPDGMWYWIIEGDHRITYGGCSIQDIELICDAWGVEAERPYDIDSLLSAAYASCNEERPEEFCFCLTARCPRKDCIRHKSRMTGAVRSADFCTPNWKNCRNFRKGE